MNTKQMTTIELGAFGMLPGAAKPSIVAIHDAAVRVRVQGIPAWRPPIC